MAYFAPLAELKILYREAGVSKYRKVPERRLKEVFDKAKWQKLLAEITKEEAEEKKTSEVAQAARFREVFLRACPAGVVRLDTFEFLTNGDLEDDTVSHYFYGPAGDLNSEFDTECSCEATIHGTHNGKEFHISIDVNVYQDMDAGDAKVYFETHTASSYASYEDKFRAAVMALCKEAGLPPQVVEDVEHVEDEEDEEVEVVEDVESPDSK